MNTTIYFYQSCRAVSVPLNRNDPRHVELADLIYKKQSMHPLSAKEKRRANKIMKELNFEPGYTADNFPPVVWHDDLWLIKRSDATGQIVEWLHD